MENADRAWRRRPDTEYTPLDVTPKQILKEMGSLNVFRYPPPSQNRVARTDGTPWCDFHYNVGHDTNDCWTLREQIEQLLKEGRLK